MLVWERVLGGLRDVVSRLQMGLIEDPLGGRVTPFQPYSLPPVCLASRYATHGSAARAVGLRVWGWGSGLLRGFRLWHPGLSGPKPGTFFPDIQTGALNHMHTHPAT